MAPKQDLGFGEVEGGGVGDVSWEVQCCQHFER